MKANLVQREPQQLKQWEQMNLYDKIVEQHRDQPKFVLHDGPPYANGHIHYGHILNKVLKDFIIKQKTMSGFRCEYIPGWDCHGLPIEIKVDQQLGGKKKEIPIAKFRQKCRQYAQKFINIQRKEFIRFGGFGQWDKPYMTMTNDYEALIVREFGNFVKNGHIYKGKKPVLWCISCQTALAEAEVEYADHNSPSIYVKFPLRADNQLKQTYPMLDKIPANLVIWTTTPWTLPANQACALNPAGRYLAVEAIFQGKPEIFILMEELAQPALEAMQVQNAKKMGQIDPNLLEGQKYCHPFMDREGEVILADFVTHETGTGCVHIAPGHGQDDYEVAHKYGLDVVNPVDDRGVFTDQAGKYENLNVFKANQSIVEDLHSSGYLLNLPGESMSHSYPHCWRCQNPVIFRATEQWFASIDKNQVRQKALQAINDVEWVPSWGKERIYGMVENRPDWCLSRQRSWGVPIVAFYCRECGEMILDQNIIEHVSSIFSQKSSDAWYFLPEKDLLPPGFSCPQCQSKEFKREEAILDVWFDSGVSWSAVCENNPRLGVPVDLYLEGSDQHRGWFNSALITSMATRGKPPYKAVLTHGFVVDGQGKKISKSKGNFIPPENILKQSGAEIFRIWSAAENYTEDIRISDQILKGLQEAYRSIRNRFRFILSNLFDFEPDTQLLPYQQLLSADKWMLAWLEEFKQKVLTAYNNYKFYSVYHGSIDFFTVDLSNFYLDIIKDRLYTSHKNAPERRSAQTVLYILGDELCRLLAPILVFTMEEIWQHLPAYSGKEESVHLSRLPEIKTERIDQKELDRWEKIRKIRTVVNKQLEAARQENKIGLPLDAKVNLYHQEEQEFLTANQINLKQALIVSQLNLLSQPTDHMILDENYAGLHIGIEALEMPKCQRCWQRSESTGQDKNYPELCHRCVEVVTTLEQESTED